MVFSRLKSKATSLFIQLAASSAYGLAHLVEEVVNDMYHVIHHQTDSHD